MNVLVTGGAGYVGTTLIPLLLDRGVDVTVLDSLMYGGAAMVPFFRRPNFRFIKGDVRDRETLEPAAEEATYLVNRMKDGGVLNNTDGPLENVIKIKPPLVFTNANADQFLARLRDVLKEDPLKG